jgi:hypothetical protein
MQKFDHNIGVNRFSLKLKKIESVPLQKFHLGTRSRVFRSKGCCDGHFPMVPRIDLTKFEDQFDEMRGSI